MIAGNKKTFALECIVTDKILGEGYIYIYINGQKFDKDSCYENISDFFYRVNDFYNGDFYRQLVIDYPRLFLLNGKDIYDFFVCLRNEQQNKLIHSKYKDVIKEYDCDSFDRGAIFRAEYSFDYCFIAMIPNKDKEKIIIANNNNETSCPENFQEIILKRGTFFKAFKQMWLHYQSYPSSILIDGINDWRI